MVIYVVKPGDSIYSIAKRYGVPAEKVIEANQLPDSSRLAVGQSLVIPQGQRTYTVRSGDSVYSIAARFGVTPESILKANPSVGQQGLIYPGQVLTVPETPGKRRSIEVNGYIFPGSTESVVRAILPSLTFLSIFSYRVSPDGSLDSINDERYIGLAREQRVAPMMVITNIRPTGGFDSNIAHSVLTDETAQTNLIKNVSEVMRSKNYYALNIDFEYVYPYDVGSYNQFLSRITGAMHELGYLVTTAVAPKLTAGQKGLLYEAHDYPAHGATVDRVILMTYEWGYLAGPPQAIAPADQVKKVVEYAVTAIPRDKILLGVPNYAYDWTLPYVRGTKADTFSNVEAVERALRNNAEIKFDETAQSPYYYYYDAAGKQHIVWFEDARSIARKLQLVDEFHLAGISYWTAGLPFPQNLLVLNLTYDITKLL